MVAVLTAGTVALFVFETVVFTTWVPAGALRWYLLGVTHAGIVASFLFLLNTTFLANDREAILHVRGAWGEENTRSELSRARRRRLIWGWVDSVTLAVGDIDHLVVTRSGGLVAIDSKFRTQVDGADRHAMARTAQKATLRAQGVIQSIVSGERGSHRARGQAIAVSPLVVVWGAVQHEGPEIAQVDGVDFVAGWELVPWLRALSGEPVSRTAAKDLLKRVEEFRNSSWTAQSERATPASKTPDRAS